VLRLVEGPAPQVGPGEVRIDVRLAEVLFVDTQVRSGWARGFFPMRPPFVPGTGVAGTVDGRRVVARTGDAGGYAEQVVVPADEVVDVPDGLDPAVALAALHDGVLATHRLDRARLRPGVRVLVTAAAGGAGHWFVPLAKAAGATVTATAGGPAKVATVRALGADVAVDHRAEGWERRLGGPFDAVFDGAGGDVGRVALARTVDGGFVSAHGAPGGSFGAQASERGITVVGVQEPIGDDEWRRRIRDGLALLAAGRVRPTVGLRVPLERAAAAHAALEARGVVGKTVLAVHGWAA
jgi:NADPH2:quinone reductase